MGEGEGDDRGGSRERERETGRKSERDTRERETGRKRKHYKHKKIHGILSCRVSLRSAE